MDVIALGVSAVAVLLSVFIIVKLNRLSEELRRQAPQENSLSEQIRALGSENMLRDSQQRQELSERITQMSSGINDQLVNMVKLNAQKLEQLREGMETNLRALNQENARQIELMRKTVDERLQTTLERRLSESFKQVSERLEQVYKGLGEMQSLAEGVGDLKKVLSNVKVRGTWGEIQLGTLLAQMLTEAQYETQVQVKPGSGERVDFAIRLPGKSEDDAQVYLPIDAKFPQEAYLRVVEASEAGDVEALKAAGAELESAIRRQAKAISEKYVQPPYTTDFALLYLPTEGLYAEAVKHPSLIDELQRAYRVTLCGPTTLSALLNSLQMGFRTLAVEKYSSEVWKLLGACKTEFEKYGELVAKTKTQLQTALNTMERVESKSRTITRKLRDVQQEEIPGLLDEGMEAEV